MSANPLTLFRRLFAYTVLTAIAITPAMAQEGGYATPLSVMKGEAIQFHISVDRPEIELRIYRFEESRKLVKIFSDVKCEKHVVPDSSFFYGCQWPVTLEYRVPDVWKSGVYDAEFTNSAGEINRITFVVRERAPGLTARIVVSLAASTWEAYNNFGGKSLYAFNSTYGGPSTRVSFERPLLPYEVTVGDDEGVEQSYFMWGNKLTTWMAQEHLPAEYIMNTDLDQDASILDHYDVMVIVGHDEYWTLAEREAVERFLLTGKRLIVLAGNTCWWQTRLTPDGNGLICYKNYRNDPVAASSPTLATDLWHTWPVMNPENKFLGTGWEYGGLVNSDTCFPKEQGYGDYGVWNAHNWVYEGTGLKDGQTFGKQDAIVGYEVDGALMEWINGVPMPTGQDSTALTFRILGMSPATVPSFTGVYRHATMGMLYAPSGGAVFNAATINWVNGLARDNEVRQITKNVFKRFLAGKFAPEIVSWSPYRVVADSLHHDRIFVNSRKLSVAPEVPLTFTVSGYDPHGEPLHYFWTVDNSGVSSDSTMKWTPMIADRGASFSVKAFVVNSHDTSMIEWTVYPTSMKIVSTPRDSVLVPHDPFRYKLDVANSNIGDTIRYQLLSAPDWLSINDVGVISGFADERPGFYSVRVRATDAHENSDTQLFVIHIPSPTAVVEHHAALSALSCSLYPSPANGELTINYGAPSAAKVSMRIFDEAGRRVRTILSDAIRATGTQSVHWDCSDEEGNSLRAGSYVVLLRAAPLDGSPTMELSEPIVILR